MTDGSAVASPDLSAMFWIARPTGSPVTAMLRATHGRATSANPPRTRASARHRAPAPNRLAVPQSATATRAPAEYSARNRAPHRAPRTPRAAAARRRSGADSARHQAWNAASPSTIMSAVPLTAATCCQTGTETKSAIAASQPAGAPNRRRPRSKASPTASQKRRRLSPRRK